MKTHQLEELLLAFSQRTTEPKFSPLSGDLQDIDGLATSLPSLERLRRQQARQLARKLYSKYHTDLDNGQAGHLVDFSGLRALVNSGEVELIRYLRAHYEHGVNESELEKLLDVRLGHLQSQPSFRLVALYQSNSSGFENAARQILLNKQRLLDQRLADLFSQTGANDEASSH